MKLASNKSLIKLRYLKQNESFSKINVITNTCTLLKKNDWIWKLKINVIVFPVNLPLRQKHRFNTLIFMFLYYNSRCSLKLHALKSIKIITTNLWYFFICVLRFLPTFLTKTALFQNMCAKNANMYKHWKTSETVSFHTFIACLYVYSLDSFYEVHIYFNTG